MKNDPVLGIRKELMAMKKPAEGIPEFENPRQLNPGQEPLTIKAGIILELSKVSDGQENIQRVDTLGRQNLVAP